MFDNWGNILWNYANKNDTSGNISSYCDRPNMYSKIRQEQMMISEAKKREKNVREEKAIKAAPPLKLLTMGVKQYLKEQQTNAQSICTHYCWFEYMDPFATLIKIGCKKQGAKNRVIVTQKEKSSGCLFSFWITVTLFFAPCFLHPIFRTQFF